MIIRTKSYDMILKNYTKIQQPKLRKVQIIN